MSASAKPSVLVEVAIDSLQGAEAAASAGAHRLELCSALELGGLTPGTGLLREIKRRTVLPVAAMVRPRSGDFCYDDRDFAVACAEVEALAAAGADLIVFGALTPDGDLDEDRMRRLCELAAPLPVTLHRAFDVAADAAATLAAAIRTGAQRILTSGGRRTAVDGAPTIAALRQQAGARIAILAGGGVRAANVRDLVLATGVREVHLGATAWEPSPMRHRNAEISFAVLPDDALARRRTDTQELQRVVAAVRSLN